MEIVIPIKFDDPLRPLFYCTSTFLKSIFTNVYKQQKPTISRLLFCLCGRGGIIFMIPKKGGFNTKQSHSLCSLLLLFISFLLKLTFTKVHKQQNPTIVGLCFVFAEGEGFEPSVPFPVRQFSKLFLSATQAPFLVLTLQT